MKVRAYAKINLGLDVVRKREDGYHELDMIMVPIDFYDVVEINFAEKTTLSSNASYLPVNQKNTMIKALNVLREEFGFSENFKIDLKKHIPSQGGLAGGSADAAATIILIDKLLNLNLDENKMIELAKKVGADVPFCLFNKPAVVQGIGEKLDFFDVNTDFWVFLAKPYHGVSTKKAFESINFDTIEHPNINNLKEALEANDYEGVINNLGNSLEQSSFKIVPKIAHLKSQLIEYGFDTALMSGSGSTVFALTKNEELVDEAINDFHKKGYFVRKTKILT